MSTALEEAAASEAVCSSSAMLLLPLRICFSEALMSALAALGKSASLMAPDRAVRAAVEETGVNEASSSLL